MQWCPERGRRDPTSPGGARGSSFRAVKLHTGVIRLFSFARRGRYAGLARFRAFRERYRPNGELLVYAARPELARTRALRIPEGIALREMDADAIALNPGVYASSASNARMCLAGGGQCFVGIVANEVVLRMWTLLLDDAGTDRLAQGASAFGPTVFVHDCWTNPEFRGRSIYASGLRWLADELHGTGVRQLILTIAPGNVSAIRACEKGGFSRVAAFPLAPSSAPGGVAVGAAPALDVNRSVAQTDSDDRQLPPAALLHVLADVMKLRGSAWIVGTGHSMHPTLRDGDAVLIVPPRQVARGEIVLFVKHGLPVVHRVIAVENRTLRTRGDAARLLDGWIENADVVGVAVARSPYSPRPGGAGSVFKLIASSDGGSRLGPITPLLPTLRFGGRAFLRFLGSRGLLFARRVMLGMPPRLRVVLRGQGRGMSARQ